MRRAGDTMTPLLRLRSPRSVGMVLVLRHVHSGGCRNGGVTEHAQEHQGFVCLTRADDDVYYCIDFYLTKAPRGTHVLSLSPPCKGLP